MAFTFFRKYKLSLPCLSLIEIDIFVNNLVSWRTVQELSLLHFLPMSQVTDKVARRITPVVLLPENEILHHCVYNSCTTVCNDSRISRIHCHGKNSNFWSCSFEIAKALNFLQDHPRMRRYKMISCFDKGFCIFM